MSEVLVASRAVLAPRRFSRHLMVSGLGFWSVTVAGALAPSALRAALYPNPGVALPFALVAPDPLGAPLLWTGLVMWCISWAFVVGHLTAAFTARHGRPSWALPALLLLGLASPLVFGFAVSVLLPLATRDAYQGNGGIPFLPAVVLQAAISATYSFLTGWRPHAGLQHTEGD